MASRDKLEEFKEDDEAEDEGFEDTIGPDSREGRRLASFWHDQINQVINDRKYKDWLKRGTTIEKRYRDDRSRVDEDGQRHYNALWANIQILGPALYGKMPLPIVERRFRDRDPAGRSASQMLERALRNEIEICGFDEAMKRALMDYLISGMGTVWVRYEPEIEEGVSVAPDSEMDIRDEAGEIEPYEDPERENSKEEDEPDIEGETHEEAEEKVRETGDRITRESTPVDYIQWTDFYMFPHNARSWQEVTAIAKRCYMTRDQMVRRFGKEIGKAIPLQKEDREMRRQYDTASGEGHESDQKAQVYEIWSRTDLEVFWIAEGYQWLADHQPDPLKLEHFFPVPSPLFSNSTNNTILPVPDYIQYQDQALQIDELTNRISMLAKACKVAGVYNAAARSIRRLLEESVENELIPVDDWAAFAEKGGVAGNISLLPLKEIIGVINELMMVKEKCVEEMDRLTGINDIMRGTSDARETLGGVRLKANNTGTRLTSRQNEVARFCRDTLRIMADIICQHFTNQSIIDVSGALYEEGLGPNPSGLDTAPPIQGGMFPQQPPPQLPAPGSPTGAAPGAPPSAPPPGGGAPPMPQQGQPPQMPGQPPQQGAPQQPPPQPQQPPQQQMPGQPPQMPGQQQHPQQMPVPYGQPPQQPPAPPQLPPEIQALIRIKNGIDLLRNEKLRGFRVDIEVDSTIYGDQQQEKGDRTQFISAITQFLGQSMQMIVQMPEITPLLGKMLQFAVRGFRVGRDLEVAIEEFCDQAVGIAKQHQQMAGAQQNPEAIKAQALIQKSQLDMQQTQMKGQIEQKRAEAEVQRQQLEAASEAQNSQADVQGKQYDIEMRKMEQQMEHIRLQIELAKLQADKQRSAMDVTQQQNEMQMQGAEMHMKGMDMQHNMFMSQHESAQADKAAQREAMMQDKQMQADDTAWRRRQAQQSLPPKVTQDSGGGL